MDTNSNTYDVILADVPWDFKVWSKATGHGRSAESHYQTMTLEAICELPIQKLASKNCALFFWGVWPRVFDCEKVIKAWGFRYATKGFTWVKMDKTNTRPVMGMGYYTRANDEFCLLATRGHMPVAVHNELGLIMSPRRAHSQKPDEQYGKIERLYPNMRYLELFARHRQFGWDAFGKQVEGSITL